MKKITCIYLIELNGKKYVGQTISFNKRKLSHKAKSKNLKYKSAIHFAIAKYGYENCIFSILEECNENELDDKEIFWIKKLNTMSPGGYNLDSGGKQNRIVSEETRNKLRIRNKERIWTNEMRNKISKFQTGKKQSQETKNKRKATMLNKSEEEKNKSILAMKDFNLNKRIYKPHSDEMKKRLSEIHLKNEKRGEENKSSIPIYCKNNNMFFGLIKMAGEWCKEQKLCPSKEAFMIKSARAKNKTFEAYGLTWVKISKNEYLKKEINNDIRE